MLLAIYLNDHLALASSARELARRAASANRGTPYAPFLDELADQLTADRRVLRELMAALEVRPDRVKAAAAWGGERLGRLKLNGRLRGYSPLSRVVELEALALLLQGNLHLWRSLEQLAAKDRRLQRFAPAERAREVEARLVELPAQCARAVHEALDSEPLGA